MVGCSRFRRCTEIGEALIAAFTDSPVRPAMTLVHIDGIDRIGNGDTNRQINFYVGKWLLRRHTTGLETILAPLHFFVRAIPSKMFFQRVSSSVAYEAPNTVCWGRSVTSPMPRRIIVRCCAFGDIGKQITGLQFWIMLVDFNHKCLVFR